MKVRHSLIHGLVAGAMLFGGIAIAQDAPAPATSPTMSESATHSATYQTAQGEVVINSVPTAAPTIGPAPDFEQLSGDSKGITAEQVASYPPLANDSLHADSNKNSRINQSGYTRWVKQLN